MAELDAFAKTRSYFQHCNYYTDKHRALLKAVAILNGSIRLEWPDDS